VAGITLPDDAGEGLYRAMGCEPLGVYRGVGWPHGQWRDVRAAQESGGVVEVSDPLPCGLALVAP